MKKVEQSENGNLARLKNHNQNLLVQIKKLKNDKRLLEQIQMEASKALGEKIQVEEKGTNTNPVNITTQENSNRIEENTYTCVGVQRMEVTSVLTNRNATINNPVHEEDKKTKINLDNATGTIREAML